MSTPSQPTEAAIKAHAYEIYQRNGCQPGHDLDNWLQAEYELRQLPVRKLAWLKEKPSPPHSAGRKSLLQVVRTAVFLM